MPLLEIYKVDENSGQLWSNNNAESINSVIQGAADHMPQPLDVLVNKLRIIVERQLLEERAVLHSIIINCR